jgi:hypothetical protein
MTDTTAKPATPALDHEFIERVARKYEEWLKVMANDLKELRTGTVFERLTAFTRIDNMLRAHEYTMKYFGRSFSVGYMAAYHGLMSEEDCKTQEGLKESLEQRFGNNPIFDLAHLEDTGEEDEITEDALKSVLAGLFRATRSQPEEKPESEINKALVEKVLASEGLSL